MEAYQITFIVAFALGMAELVPSAFHFWAWSAVALIQWATSGFFMNRDLLVFAVLVVVFIVRRKIVARASDQETAGKDVNHS